MERRREGNGWPEDSSKHKVQVKTKSVILPKLVINNTSH
jgi:hypothetical protein